MSEPKNLPGLALITGASAGIGEQLAHLFAKDGHSLVLVARRKERLDALAAELEQAHKVKVHTIAHDLGAPGAGAALVETLKAQGLDAIDFLVNNAGIGSYGQFASSDYAQIMTLVNLNICTLVELTHLILPGMLARKRGRIMNVGSVAGFQPGPGMAVYYASKAFVYSFTEALVGELHGTPVTVTNLSPGATKTEFQDVAQMAESWLFALGTTSSTFVARSGYKGMMAGKPLVIPGATNKFLATSVRFVPRPVLRRVVRKINSDKG